MFGPVEILVWGEHGDGFVVILSAMKARTSQILGAESSRAGPEVTLFSSCRTFSTRRHHSYPSHTGPIVRSPDPGFLQRTFARF